VDGNSRQVGAIRLAVAGAAGRMGRCTLERASCDPRFLIVAALVAPDSSNSNRSIRAAEWEFEASDRLQTDCDVLVDFSDPDGTAAWVEACRSRKIPMVIGSTGHIPVQQAKINAAAEALPIVQSSNFSVGMQTLLEIVGRVATALGDDFDVEIVEMHHRKKVDAPSGTATSLVEAIQMGGTSREFRAPAFGRHGVTGERPLGQIGVHSVRMGGVVGQHEIHFSSGGETLTLRHAAHSREAFADGALRAAAWIVDRPPGLYSMRDVLSSELATTGGSP